MPALAQASTMPAPMTPHPTTPTFRTSSAFIPSSHPSGAKRTRGSVHGVITLNVTDAVTGGSNGPVVNRHELGLQVVRARREGQGLVCGGREGHQPAVQDQVNVGLVRHRREAV